MFHHKSYLRYKNIINHVTNDFDIFGFVSITRDRHSITLFQFRERFTNFIESATFTGDHQFCYLVTNDNSTAQTEYCIYRMVCWRTLIKLTFPTQFVEIYKLLVQITQ